MTNQSIFCSLSRLFPLIAFKKPHLRYMASTAFRYCYSYQNILPLRCGEKDSFMQLFLHYVRKNGSCADYAYDKNQKCYDLLTK